MHFGHAFCNFAFYSQAGSRAMQLASLSFSISQGSSSSKVTISRLINCFLDSDSASLDPKKVH